MNDREVRRYDTLVRVKTFGETNAADMAAGSKAADKFAIVSQVVAELFEAAARQKRNRNTSKEVLLDAVRLDIQNITRTANAIAIEELGFADTFRPPDNSNEAELMKTAKAFLQQLVADPDVDSPDVQAAKADLTAKFVAHELSPDFATHLQSDCDAITSGNQEQEDKREKQVGSTAIIGERLKAGMDAVTVLNAIMHNKYASQADKLAAWVSASHVERDPQKSKKTPAPNPPPTPQ